MKKQEGQMFLLSKQTYLMIINYTYLVLSSFVNEAVDLAFMSKMNKTQYKSLLHILYLIKA